MPTKCKTSQMTMTMHELFEFEYCLNVCTTFHLSAAERHSSQSRMLTRDSILRTHAKEVLEQHHTLLLSCSSWRRKNSRLPSLVKKNCSCLSPHFFLPTVNPTPSLAGQSNNPKTWTCAYGCLSSVQPGAFQPLPYADDKSKFYPAMILARRKLE